MINFLHKPSNLIILFLTCLIGIGLSNSIESQQLPRYGSRYNIPIPYIPTSLDPHQSSSPVSRMILSNVYEGLVKENKDGGLEPGLAETWQTADTGLTWFFILRRDITFHNGEIFDANAVKYSFERLLHPEIRSPKSWIMDNLAGGREFFTGQTTTITGIQILEPQTVMFQFKTPEPLFPNYLASLSVSMVSPSTTNSITDRPVGSGPFMIRNIDSNRILLVQNPLYREGRPYLDSIEYTFISSEENQMLEFELHRLQETLLPETEFHRMMSDEKWKNYIHKNRQPVFHYIGCNLTRSPMNNIRFRQLLSLCIDRNQILGKMLNSHGMIAETYAPVSGIYLASRDTTQLIFPYSLESAKSISRPFTRITTELLVPAGSSVIRYIAQQIQLGVQQAGIQLTIKELNYPEYIQAIQSGNYDLYYGTYYREINQPDYILRELFTERNRGLLGNTSYFYNSEFMNLITKFRTLTSDAERYQSIQHLLHILKGNIPIIPLYNLDQYILHQPVVHGWDVEPGNYADYCSIWLAEK